ncbi:hypothetical protein [Paenisporosarcina sp. TG-14]|nr:hypothetical protein [Paenisporosarcina sp. TG-14]
MLEIVTIFLQFGRTIVLFDFIICIVIERYRNGYGRLKSGT